MPGNFAEFGPESSGPGLALSKQSEWALQSQQALQAAASAEYYKAHARLAGSEADLKEQEARDAKLMATWGQRGMEGTAGAPQEKLQSLASPIEAAANFALEKLGPGKTYQNLATQASTVRQHEATARNQASEQAVRENTLWQHKIEALAAEGAWAMQDEQNYNQFRLKHADDNLPENFAQGKLIIGPLVAQGMKTSEILANRIAQANSDSLIADRKSAMQERNVKIKELGASTDLLKQKLDTAIKNDGPNSESARKLRQQQGDLAETRRELIKQNAAEPPMGGWTVGANKLKELTGIGTPTTQKIPASALRIVGKDYTNEFGVTATWTAKGWQVKEEP